MTTDTDERFHEAAINLRDAVREMVNSPSGVSSQAYSALLEFDTALRLLQDDDTSFYRHWSHQRKTAKHRRLEEVVSQATDSDGWTKHTEFHWQRKLHGDLLDYWPSTGKWAWRGQTHKAVSYSALMGFITLENEK